MIRVNLGFRMLKKKLCPAERDPPMPMAKRNTRGNLVTALDSLKILYLETYVDRLKHREIKPDLVDISTLNF